MASSVNPTSIPPISTLRQKLGYGDSHSANYQSISFYESVRAFRKTFVTSQGYEGSAMHDWKSSEHQTALEEMVQAFLDCGGNGARLWPDEPVQDSLNKLKYSVHGTRIKRILKQLFWRMNLQQHRNEKYRKTKGKTGNIHIRTFDGRGSHEDPIDVDEIEESLKGSSALGMFGTSSLTRINVTAARSKSFDLSEIDSTSEEPQELLQLQREVCTDLQHEPEGHGQGDENTSDQNPFAGPTADRQFAPYADMNPSEPPTKRPMVDSIDSFHQTSKEKRDNTPVGPRGSRTSSRKRQEPQRDGFATGQRLSEALQAMEDECSLERDAGAISCEANLEVPGGSFTGVQEEPGLRIRENSAENVTDRETSVDAFADEMITQLNAETEMRSLQHEEVITSTETSAPADTLHQMSPAAERKKTVSFLEDMRRSETMAVEPNESIDSPQTTSLRQARVKFVYRIITRYPTRRSCIWKPRGSFRTKTLAELEDELPLQFERSELKYLLIRLEDRDTHADQIVSCGREDEFDALKRHLVDFIRCCIAESLPDEEVSIFIDIEPLPTLDSTEKSSEMELITFEW